MELGLGGAKFVAHTTRRERRIMRAAWWFTQMRQMVDRAFDWETAGAPPPEQIWFPGSQRHVQV